MAEELEEVIQPSEIRSWGGTQDEKQCHDCKQPIDPKGEYDIEVFLTEHLDSIYRCKGCAEVRYHGRE